MTQKQKKPPAPDFKTKNKNEDPRAWAKTKIPFLSRLSAKEKIIFFKYLAVMIDAGTPLEKGLIAIHSQSRSALMHKILHIILTDVASGEFLSTSLKKMPQLFDPMSISLITVGENSGTLSQSLLRIGEQIEKSQELKHKIQSALLYPVIVIVATGAIAAYLLLVLLPQITPMFQTLNVKIPWTTRVVVAASSFVLHNGIYLLLGFVVFVICVMLLLRIPKIRFVFDAMLLRLPVMGRLVKQVQIAQFSRILGTLLKSGVTIIEALSIAGTALSNAVYRQTMLAMSREIQNGSSISTHLFAKRNLFPPFITQMISMGEESGKLDDSFLFVASFAEREVDDATKTLTTVLEPLLMLAIGGLVGFIAIAIITPIYQLTSGIKY